MPRHAHAPEPTAAQAAEVARWRAYWRSERNSAHLFAALAEAERKPRDAALYRNLAAQEDAHAAVWSERIARAGGSLPAFRPSLRSRILAGLAARTDPAVVLAAAARAERRDAKRYHLDASAAAVDLAREEGASAEILDLRGQAESAEYAKKLILRFRRYAILAVGGALFAAAVALGRNVQIEGLLFGLLGGALTGAVVHYLIAKVLVALPLGRVWCGWACWTAAVLDQLPFRTSEGWLPGNAGAWRYASLAGSLALVLALASAGYAGGLYGASGVAWFVGGNALYWAVGVVLAYRLEDNRAFCKYVCPVALLLRVTARPALVKVAGDADACGACPATPCRNLCPMDIDIPAYVARGERVLSSECILCQHCVAVCPPNALRLTVGLDVSRVDRLQERPQPVPTAPDSALRPLEREKEA